MYINSLQSDITLAKHFHIIFSRKVEFLHVSLGREDPMFLWDLDCTTDTDKVSLSYVSLRLHAYTSIG